MIIEIVLLLAAFGIKHFVCDFLLQYNNMVREKGTYGAPGGLYHAGIHGWFTFMVLIPFYPIIAVPAAILDAFIHYHIDWAKQQLNRGLTVADKMFWVWFGADQCLHYLTYVLIIGVLAGVF